MHFPNITTYAAGVAQASTHRKLQKYCDEVLAEFGITKMQWLIIGTVLDSGEKGVRLSDLAVTMGTNLPYLTNTINLLESKNILERKEDASDSRAKRVMVNGQFAKKCDLIEKTLRDKLRKTIYAQISPEEFRIYMKVTFQLGEIESE
jgi:DNA-binding MarR family transcriptional regulator